MVLDTHIWFWWINEEYHRFPAAWMERITNTDKVVVYPVSCFEIALAHQRGKLTLPCNTQKPPRSSHRTHGNAPMPTISLFYGILIRMFFKDIEKHHRPHIHADYQGQVGIYAIDDGELLAGGLPPAKHKLVVAWIEIHKDDLAADWQLAVNGKPPLAIKGLDQ